MTIHDFIFIGLFISLIIVLTPIIGSYISLVFREEKPFRLPILSYIENAIYKISRIDPHEQMHWKDYACAVLMMNVLGIVFLFLIQIFQNHLFLNPQHFSKVSLLSALNTAVSFVTNTNWQTYAGETTMSYFTQVFGLTVQNFLSAATAISIVAALARGFVRETSGTIGNFWSDLVKSTLYILLPLSCIMAVLLVQQGVVQTFSPYVHAITLEGTQQTIPLGPAASQVAIKQLGTNGGGFFNTNSAHPFENPTPLTNFIQILAIFLIPGALTYAFGKLIGSTRQGWVLFSTMMIIFLIGLSTALYAEYMHNPLLQTAGSMEGKELRFGISGSTLFSVVTTAASCGAVNCMHESLAPLTGLVTLFNMMMGEVVFGGVGSGLYGMVLFAIIAVFIAGLMVGRTPEYLGKKIDVFEIKMAVIGILTPSIVLLLFSAVACTIRAGTNSLAAQGPMGLNEILYAFASTSNNNGSAFGGLNATTSFYTITTTLAMLVGRFATMIPVLAIAGSLVEKKSRPVTLGTFPTDGVLFLVLLIGTVFVIGALNFFPVLSIGPILEHLLLISGKGL
jgi:potassium-transporting ATPase potassium-binding subunit